MEQEPTVLLSQELQKVLLSSNSASSTAFKQEERQDAMGNGKSYDTEDLLELNPQIFDRWVPYLRASLEKDQLGPVTDELRSSIEENFEDLESQLLHESQINDKLKTSIGQISTIQDLIENSLLQDVTTLQQELTRSTNDVIMKKQVYVSNKKTALKITEASIVVSKVLRILELSNKCQELISEADFFKALQNLDNLEKIYLQEFKSYNFQFLKEIYESIPYLKSSIKDECINLIRNSFNSNLGKNLARVGSNIFDVYQNELLANWLHTKDDMKLGSFKFNSPVEISLRKEDVLAKLDLKQFFHLDEFHDSILIFESLNELPYLFAELRKEYQFRKTKIVQPLSWKKISHKENAEISNDIETDAFGKQLTIDFVKDYFLKILGFLLYDLNLNQETDYIIVDNNYNATNEFWDGLMARLTPYMKHFIEDNLQDAHEVSDLKNFLCVYVSILENYKLNIGPLYKLLIIVFQKYCTISSRSFESEFEVLLNDDDFMPLTINDKNLYEKVIKICWMKDDDDILNTSLLPDDNVSITLPFSPLYPMTCTLIKKTYSSLLHFIGDFYLHELQTISSILVNTMDFILNDVVNQRIRSKLDSTSREEIAQILINLDYFIEAAKKFSKVISKENLMQNPDIEIRLSAIEEYMESRKYAETKLITLIDSKITDILETVSLDWDAQIVRQEPDISIVDVAQFLEMMFASTLVNLPYSVQTLLIFREFDSLTTQLLAILLYETPEHISQASVQNFQLDMQYLKEIIPRIFPTSTDTSTEIYRPSTPLSPTFNNNSHSPALFENNVKSLQATFTELDQCIELLKGDNYRAYMNPDIRMRRFARIKPENAAILIQKVQDNTHSIELSNDSQSKSGINGAAAASDTNKIANFFNRL